MYDIYERRINSAFAGNGTLSLIVKDGIILAHVRAWDNPQVADDDFKPALKGQPVARRGKGWRKLSGFEAENAQGWAGDVVG